jgi:hypothetical protein
MNRRSFLLSSGALILAPGVALAAEPAATYASPPTGYTAPYRAWGPSRDEIPVSGPGRHEWRWEIAPTDRGPFRQVRPHAYEWWDGKAWIGTD